MAEEVVDVAASLRANAVDGGLRVRTDPFGFRVCGRAQGFGFADGVVVDLPDRGSQALVRRPRPAL
ncbi:hypothetical protein ACFYNW_23970 [Streptomyces virginiae]|uniref:hypothetical protein n=1 Tax=Streptomyces virginiae TaxID=1961 RepID=UPI0036E2EC32